MLPQKCKKMSQGWKQILCVDLHPFTIWQSVTEFAELWYFQQYLLFNIRTGEMKHMQHLILMCFLENKLGSFMGSDGFLSGAHADNRKNKDTFTQNVH